MPGGDRRGPLGEGAATGRGMGPCGRGLRNRPKRQNAAGYGGGRGFQGGARILEEEPVTEDKPQGISTPLLSDELSAIRKELQALRSEVNDIRKQHTGDRE